MIWPQFLGMDNPTNERFIKWIGPTFYYNGILSIGGDQPFSIGEKSQKNDGRKCFAKSIKGKKKKG